MDQILTPAQVAERLQVKPSWVYEQTRERAEVRNADPLPHIKMGRYLRFDWQDILDWLERQKCGSRPLSLRPAESGA
jgi:predicted DNA-binding transcriptional regulator AlpA